MLRKVVLTVTPCNQVGGYQRFEEHTSSIFS